MGKSCCQTPEPDDNAHNNPRWHLILRIALIANTAMFVVEIVAGVAADSRALQADALDFFGDAANYAIGLGVAGLALSWRAKAALEKAAAMLVFGVWVIGYAIYDLVAEANQEPQTMGVICTLALAVNVIVALLLFRYREGDSNMRSVWICSRKDAIGNIAILGAALGVFEQAREELAHG